MIHSERQDHRRGSLNFYRYVLEFGKYTHPDVDKNLLAHELIKIRFGNFKKQKAELAEEIARQTDSAVAGLIGNIAILYRFHPDASQRKIRLP